MHLRRLPRVRRRARPGAEVVDLRYLFADLPVELRVVDGRVEEEARNREELVEASFLLGTENV